MYNTSLCRYIACIIKHTSANCRLAHIYGLYFKFSTEILQMGKHNCNISEKFMLLKMINLLILREILTFASSLVDRGWNTDLFFL